jgi:hypothetical protein
MWIAFSMCYRPIYTAELPSGPVDPVEDYADNVTSDYHVDPSDQLAIHLHLGYIPTVLDASIACQSSESVHFSHHSTLVSNCYERYALPFSFMTESPPASPGMPGEACKTARIYSVGELLTMRDKLPFVICDVNKLNPRVNSGMKSRFHYGL